MQVSCGYQLFAKENDSCESCLKSPFQVWTFVILLRKEKWGEHAVVQFCFLLEYSSTQTYALMKTASGNDALGWATIFGWYAFFAAGRASAATLLRSGWSKMSSTGIMVNVIEAIIMEDRSLMVRELGAMLDNFCTSFFSSLKFGRGNSNRFYMVCHSVAFTLPFSVKLGLSM